MRFQFITELNQYVFRLAVNRKNEKTQNEINFKTLLHLMLLLKLW